MEPAERYIYASIIAPQQVELVRRSYREHARQVEGAALHAKVRWHVAVLEEQLGHYNGFLMMEDFVLPTVDEYRSGNVFLAACVIGEALRELTESTLIDDRSRMAIDSLCRFLETLASKTRINSHVNSEDVHWLLYCTALVLGRHFGISALANILQSEFGREILRRARVVSGYSDLEEITQTLDHFRTVAEG